MLLNIVKGEQESFWGTNGQKVCHQMEVLLNFHLKLKVVFGERRGGEGDL